MAAHTCANATETKGESDAMVCGHASATQRRFGAYPVRPHFQK